VRAGCVSGAQGGCSPSRARPSSQGAPLTRAPPPRVPPLTHPSPAQRSPPSPAVLPQLRATVLGMGFTYTEIFLKDNSVSTWNLRRDVSVGVSKGQCFYTAAGVFVARVWCTGGGVPAYYEDYVECVSGKPVAGSGQGPAHSCCVLAGQRARSLHGPGQLLREARLRRPGLRVCQPVACTHCACLLRNPCSCPTAP